MRESGGKWTLATNILQHKNYVYGDRGSIENLNGFTNSLHGRRLSLEESSFQADAFEQALRTVMSLPGDCHIRLNMSQSIFECF